MSSVPPPSRRGPLVPVDHPAVVPFPLPPPPPAWGLRDDRIPGTDQAVRGGRHGQKVHSGSRPPQGQGNARGSTDARSSADACLSWQKVQGREANRRRHRLTEPTPKALCQPPPPHHKRIISASGPAPAAAMRLMVYDPLAPSSPPLSPPPSVLSGGGGGSMGKSTLLVRVKDRLIGAGCSGVEADWTMDFKGFRLGEGAAGVGL